MHRHDLDGVGVGPRLRRLLGRPARELLQVRPQPSQVDLAARAAEHPVFRPAARVRGEGLVLGGLGGRRLRDGVAAISRARWPSAISVWMRSASAAASTSASGATATSTAPGAD
ncbi:MAG: hypothetical protein ACRDN9_02190, partial [Streptosporangiaceae bacterium]